MNEPLPDCCVCLVEPATVRLYPCRHQCLCQACEQLLLVHHSLDRCPLCRCPLGQVIARDQVPIARNKSYTDVLGDYRVRLVIGWFLLFTAGFLYPFYVTESPLDPPSPPTPRFMTVDGKTCFGHCKNGTCVIRSCVPDNASWREQREWLNKHRQLQILSKEK